MRCRWLVVPAVLVLACDSSPSDEPSGETGGSTTAPVTTASSTGSTATTTGVDEPTTTGETTGQLDSSSDDTGEETTSVSGCPVPDVPDGMVCVAESTFEMGSFANSDEQPLRSVFVSTFFIDADETTVADYAACVDAGACPAGKGLNEHDTCNWQIAGRDDHPINCILWVEAEAYCAWAGKRLPTEAEWELAARGTDGRDYPWGEKDLTCDHAVWSDGTGPGCGADSTAPVGSRSPLGDSPYGARDMAGNAAEWVSDWWAESYDPADTNDPQGPADGTWKALRGGGFATSTPGQLRGNDRDSGEPDVDDFLRTANWGVRCAQTP